MNSRFSVSAMSAIIPNCADLFLLRVHILDLISYSLPTIHVHISRISYLGQNSSRILITVAAPCLTSLQLRRTEAASIAMVLFLLPHSRYVCFLCSSKCYAISCFKKKKLYHCIQVVLLLLMIAGFFLVALCCGGGEEERGVGWHDWRRID